MMKSIKYFMEANLSYFPNILLALMFHVSNFYSLFNSKMIKHMISLDGENALFSCYISGLERDLIYYDHF